MGLEFRPRNWGLQYAIGSVSKTHREELDWNGECGSESAYKYEWFISAQNLTDKDLWLAIIQIWEKRDRNFAVFKQLFW